MEKDVYIAEMTRNGARYSAKIDVMTGKVLSLIQLSEPQENLPKVLSKEEYEVIAQKISR